jgi:hypothetical protein
LKENPSRAHEEEEKSSSSGTNPHTKIAENLIARQTTKGTFARFQQ